MGHCPIDPEEWADRTDRTADDYRKRIRAFLGQMRVLDGWELAPFGRRLAELRRERGDLLGDAAHVQLYTLHWHHPDHYASFAYAAVCDWLHARGRYEVDGSAREHLVEVGLGRIAEVYGYPTESVAFSLNSVTGATHWLRAVEPTVLTATGKDRTDHFQRRRAAPWQSVLWAVTAYYRRRGIPLGTRLERTPEVNDALARALLLEPEDLSGALEMARAAHDLRREGGLFGLGTQGGFGSWLQLNAPFPVGALAPAAPEDYPDDALAPVPTTADEEDAED